MPFATWITCEVFIENTFLFLICLIMFYILTPVYPECVIAVVKQFHKDKHHSITTICVTKEDACTVLFRKKWFV